MSEIPYSPMMAGSKHSVKVGTEYYCYCSSCAYSTDKILQVVTQGEAGMPVKSYEKGKVAFKLDKDGYPLLYEGKTCVKCKAKVDPETEFKDEKEGVDKKRRFFVLGYCNKCHKKIMGW